MKNFLCLTCGLLFLFVQQIQGQDTGGSNQPKNKSNVIPKVSINIGGGSAFAFGNFARSQFKKTDTHGFDFDNADGGFATRGWAVDASIGVRVSKKVGIIARVFSQELAWNNEAIERELIRQHGDRQWQINTMNWKVFTYTAGVFNRRYFPGEELFWEGRLLAGVAFASVPVGNFRIGDRREPLFGFQANYPVNPLKKYEAGFTTIAGTSIGVKFGRHFSVMGSIDVVLSRVVFKNLYQQDEVYAGAATKTLGQNITTISPTLMLSYSID